MSDYSIQKLRFCREKRSFRLQRHIHFVSYNVAFLDILAAESFTFFYRLFKIPELFNIRHIYVTFKHLK
jgi:hypothetical protein